MKTAAQKKPMTPIDLVALANASELPKHLRSAVAAAFDAGPQAVEDLQAARDRVPEPPVADPFVSSLRRLSWPSERLPGRHRKAIGAVGHKPLAFVRLVVEEARTFSWRAQSPDALSTVVKWIVPWAKAGCTKDHLQLAGRTLGYRQLVANCTLIFEDRGKLPDFLHELGTFVAANQERCSIPLEAEGIMAVEMSHRFQGNEARPDTSQLVRNMAEDSDTLILLDFMEAFLADLRGEDDFAVDTYIKALEHRDFESDPWLEIFLGFSAARALINTSVNRIPDLESLLAENMAETPARPEPGDLSPEERLLGKFQSAIEREFPLRREPALRHLEAVEPLFHEFHTPQMAVHYYWLLVECHRAFNIYKALDYCCDAVLAAEALYPPDDSRIEHMLVTAGLICQTARGHDLTPAERRIAIERRVQEIIEPRLNRRREVFQSRLAHVAQDRPAKR